MENNNKNEVQDLDLLAEKLVGRVQDEGFELLGPDGVLTQLTSTVLSKALQVEMDVHLGYAKGDPAGRGSGNSRNGATQKKVLSDTGAIPVEVPRDRNATFEPKLVPKHQRRIAGLDDMVLGLFSRGMTTRDICSQLNDTYDIDMSPTLVSKITDAVMPEVVEWRSRPLDEMYPVMYLDAIVVKIRTDGKVVKRPLYVALAINLDGEKQVLGIELGDGSEGAKFWLSFCTNLKNRGVDDVIITCCDGLTGFSDAIEAVWPQATVQTCVVHLIRNSLKYVGYQDRKKVAAKLKPIYKASNEEAALQALAEFDDTYGGKYPAIVKTWENAWERFTPFLGWDEQIRKVIYTTNAIESLNYQLRKVTKTRGSFPTDDACYKLVYLAICNTGKAGTGKQVAGTKTQGWKQALNMFAIAYPERIRI